MEKNNEWMKRRIRYFVNNNIICKIFLRLYYRFEELIWLGVSVGLFLFIIKMFSSSF